MTLDSMKEEDPIKARIRVGNHYAKHKQWVAAVDSFEEALKMLYLEQITSSANVPLADSIAQRLGAASQVLEAAEEIGLSLADSASDVLADLRSELVAQFDKLDGATHVRAFQLPESVRATSQSPEYCPWTIV